MKLIYKQILQYIIVLTMYFIHPIAYADLDHAKSLYCGFGIGGLLDGNILGKLGLTNNINTRKVYPSFSLNCGVYVLKNLRYEFEFGKSMILDSKIESITQHNEIQRAYDSDQNFSNNPSWYGDQNKISGLPEEYKSKYKQGRIDDRNDPYLYTKEVPKYTGKFTQSIDLFQVKSYIDILKFNQDFSIYAGFGVGVANIKLAMQNKFKALYNESNSHPHDNTEYDEYKLEFDQVNQAYSAMLGIEFKQDEYNFAVEYSYQNLGQIKKDFQMGKHDNDSTILPIDHKFLIHAITFKITMNI